jgi:hypothetical protein
MRQTTYSGLGVWVLDVAPNWQEGVSVEGSVVSQVEQSLTNREGRRAHGATLRLRSRFTIICEGEAARRVSGGLRSLKDEAVAIPLWPAARLWEAAGTAPIGGGLLVAYTEDWSEWEIYEAGSEPRWPVAGRDWYAPLVWGRLETREPRWLRADMLELLVEHTESSPAGWAVAPAAMSFGAGPGLTGYAVAPRLFPFEINFTGSGEVFLVSVIRDQVGFGREPAQTFYTQLTAAERESAHYLSGTSEVGELLEFFRQHGGWKAFWVPEWTSAVRLTADVGAGDTVLQVEDTANIEAGDYVAFVRMGETALVTGKVQSKGTTTVTLTAAAGAAMSAGGTLVSRLLLARFREPRVTVLWRSLEWAECSVTVRELPAEYSAAAEETLGTTLGELPARCWLYEFSRVLAGVTHTDRYTSFESNLVYGGQTYCAKKLTHGEVAQGLYLDRDQVEVQSDLWEGNPLLLLATLKMDAPLRCVIRSAVTVDGVNASGAGVVFTGEVESVGLKGSRLNGKVSSGGSLFERMVPRFLMQLGCNHGLFRPGCGLAKADWKFTAVVTDPGVAGYPFEFEVGSLARMTGPTPVYFENWFAGGWMEFGSGTGWCRRAIMLSSEVVDGVVTVTLDRDPEPYPEADDAVVLYPGCDLRAATCKGYDAEANTGGKFDNYLNFGGHPHLPVGNPSLITRRASSGGKK